MLVCIVIKCTESDYFAVLNERINRKSWQQCSKLQLLGNLTIAEFKLLKQFNTTKLEKQLLLSSSTEVSSWLFHLRKNLFLSNMPSFLA